MEIQIPQILFQVLNFAVIFYVFKRYVYEKVLKMMDDRASKIQDGIEAAEKNIQLNQEIGEKKKQEIAQAKAEAKEIIAQAKAEAKQIKSEAKKAAKLEAKEVLATERQALEAELNTARKQFSQQANQVVLDSVEAVMTDLVDVKLNQKLVDKQIKQISNKIFE